MKIYDREDVSTSTYTAERTRIGDYDVTVCLDDEGPISPAFHWSVGKRDGTQLTRSFASSIDDARGEAIGSARMHEFDDARVGEDGRWVTWAAADTPPVERILTHYSARWIDHSTWVDNPPDRQGFAYVHHQYKMMLGGELRTSDAKNAVLVLARDEARQIISRELPGGLRYSLDARRAGGYFYVDAYITEV